MPTDSPKERLPLPPNSTIRHFKDQAREMVRDGVAPSTFEAQFRLAHKYGFPSWPTFAAHLDSLKQATELAQTLKQAIDTNNLEQVKRLMTSTPALHTAPLGYGKNGPLTWVAECRVPWEPPRLARLGMAKWMIENGSDLHQGGDGPLMRAALMGYRIPMMELLLERGADVNAEWDGYYPILFAPCETLEPESIRWLLEHGANPNCARAGRKYPQNAIDFVLGTYSRSPRLAECIDLLMEAGSHSSLDNPLVLALLRNRLEELSAYFDAEPPLLHRRFQDLEIGVTAKRALTLRGATLLHVAAEYGNLDAVKLLLERGADVNQRAAVDSNGVGGQTPIFHAVTQFRNYGLPVAQALLEHGADLKVKATIPGHYDRPGEMLECTPLRYAERFPGEDNRCVALLKERGATE